MLYLSICSSCRDARCNGNYLPESTISRDSWCCKCAFYVAVFLSVLFSIFLPKSAFPVFQVDEYMENKGIAAATYSKAMHLLSFIAGEATLLPLNPPFSLAPANKKRIQQYILSLHSHQTNFLKSQPSLRQTPGSMKE